MSSERTKVSTVFHKRFLLKPVNVYEHEVERQVVVLVVVNVVQGRRKGGLCLAHAAARGRRLGDGERACVQARREGARRKQGAVMKEGHVTGRGTDRHTEM